MHLRRAATVITPALAGVFLIAFALSGLMTGALARGFVHSLLATPPAATPSTVRRTPTHPPKAPTLPVPNVQFALQLSVSAQHVSPGDALTIVAFASAAGTSTPLGGVPCVLRTPRNGTPPLLAAWPTPQSTNAQGKATWQVTVPHVAEGWYGIEVSATGASNYSYWTWTRVYVNG